MKTTSIAGRAWHFSHSMGRPSAEHNTSKWGKTGGYVYPVSVAVAPDGSIYVPDAGNHIIQKFSVRP